MCWDHTNGCFRSWICSAYMAWDNRHLLCSPQLECNRLCSCSSLQVCMLLILVNKFSLLLFFYIRLLVIARILWLGAHIFYNGFHYREQFARLPCKSCRFDQCSPAVSPPEQFIRKGNGAVAHELLSFSAYFYLFTCSRTLIFFSVFHMLTPSLLLLLTPFFYTCFYREIRASQRCVFMNWLIFIIYQNWSILHNKFPQKILWAMFHTEKSRREGEGTDYSTHWTLLGWVLYFRHSNSLSFQ